MRWRLRKRRAQREREQSQAHAERAELEVKQPLQARRQQFDTENHVAAMIARSLRANGNGA